MPIGRARITKRRAADNRVSKAFGHALCSTHSPNAARPGDVGTRLVDGFERNGYKIRFQGKAEPEALIEVYPHIALLALMSSPMRLPYKSGKTNRYWKEPLPQRRRNLLIVWHEILARLKTNIGHITLQLPATDSDLPLARLKPYEDMLDALLCAWVGTFYVDNDAQALGDSDSAIWLPSISMQFAKVTHDA
jgi:predicted RNase H-like nuclease